MRAVISKRHFPMLLALASAKPTVRTLILKYLDKTTIRVLALLAANILHGNIELDDKQKRNIRKFKNLLKILRYKCIDIEQKRNALIQHGGFLPFLLPIIASITGALVSRAIK